MATRWKSWVAQPKNVKSRLTGKPKVRTPPRFWKKSQKASRSTRKWVCSKKRGSWDAAVADGLAAEDGVAPEAGLAAEAGLAPDDGTQRTASATTTPSASSDRPTPVLPPGLKLKLPSDCQSPPRERWSTLIEAVPAA